MKILNFPKNTLSTTPRLLELPRTVSLSKDNFNVKTAPEIKPMLKDDDFIWESSKNENKKEKIQIDSDKLKHGCMFEPLSSPNVTASTSTLFSEIKKQLSKNVHQKQKSQQSVVSSTVVNMPAEPEPNLNKKNSFLENRKSTKVDCSDVRKHLFDSDTIESTGSGHVPIPAAGILVNNESITPI